MSTLTLSWVMIPCDWIGIVTIAQRHLPQPVDDRDDEPQAGFPDTDDPPEPKQHTLLITGQLHVHARRPRRRQRVAEQVRVGAAPGVGLDQPDRGVHPRPRPVTGR